MKALSSYMEISICRSKPLVMLPVLPCRSHYFLELGTHFYPWVESSTIQVNMLPDDVSPYEITGATFGL